MSANSPVSSESPALLQERSLGGIFVHLFGLVTGVFGAGLVYLLAKHPYTRANARHALNWHLGIFALTIVGVITFVLGADEVTRGDETVEWALLPEPLDTIVGVIGMVLIAGVLVAWLLTFIFVSIATVKAVFGTAWQYPLAPTVVSESPPESDWESIWPQLVGIYVVIAPLMFAGVLGLAVTAGDVPEGAIFAIAVIIVVAVGLALLAAAAIVLDVRNRRGTDASWQPHWAPYIGIPLVGAACAYAIRSSVYVSESPAGDAVYVGVALLWLTAITYRWRRRTR